MSGWKNMERLSWGSRYQRCGHVKPMQQDIADRATLADAKTLTDSRFASSA